MAGSDFSHSSDQLRQIAADVLAHARASGATAAETEVSEGFGQGVTVRKGEVENIEYNRDKGVGVTVYIGRQRGHASTSDFSARALRETVEAAPGDLAAAYPGCDMQKLRELVRNVQRERDEGKPPRSYRALFQELRRIVPDPLDNAAA